MILGAECLCLIAHKIVLLPLINIVCVECLFLRTPSRAPYRTPPACANRGAAYPDPPPVVPHPESIAAQAAYAEALLPGSAPARIVSRHWGPPRACYRVPYCDKGDPSGTAAAECPEEEEPPVTVTARGASSAASHWRCLTCGVGYPYTFGALVSEKHPRQAPWWQERCARL